MSVDIAELNTESGHRQRVKTAVQYILATGAARKIGLGETGLSVFMARHGGKLVERNGVQERQGASNYLREVNAAVAAKQALDRGNPIEVRKALDVSVRAAIGGGTSDTWAAPLVGTPVFFGPLALEVRRKQALGRIPGAVEVPPNVRAPFPTAYPDAKWITRGGSIPVSRAAFASKTLEPFQIGSILVASNELVQGTGPSFEAIFSTVLMRTAVAVVDDALLNPSNGGQPEIAPPAITFGAFSTPSTGASALALNADIGLLADNMDAAGVAMISPVLIMSPTSALRLGAVTLPGTGLALPVIQSPAAADNIILIDSSYLMFCDGGIDISPSDQTTLEMSDTPTGNVAIPEAAMGAVINLWKTDSVAFRLVQFVRWELADPAACGYVTGFGAPTP